MMGSFWTPTSDYCAPSAADCPSSAGSLTTAPDGGGTMGTHHRWDMCGDPMGLLSATSARMRA